MEFDIADPPTNYGIFHIFFKMKTSLLGGLSNNVQFLFTVARGFGEFLHSKKEHPINTGGAIFGNRFLHRLCHVRPSYS